MSSLSHHFGRWRRSNQPRLRTVATFLIASLVLLFSNSGAIYSKASAAPAFESTDQFLQASFTGGQFIAGMTAGTPDYGFSLEGLLQRKALGESPSQLYPAVKFLLLDASRTGSPSNPTGYLFTDGRLRLGLAGKWAFAGAVIGAKNERIRRQILGLALTKIDGTGDVAPDARANTYDRAWLVLGLSANGLQKQASLLASNIADHQMPDGGFNDGFDTATSSVDGTGITLQALAAARLGSSSKAAAAMGKVQQRAVRYLNARLEKDHFAAYGDADVNGTAYAIMGLLASGATTDSAIQWLREQRASDGGLMTPWSSRSGDIFATAQGVTAMLGKSYLNLLQKKALSHG